jgi:hypothetical protein
VLNATHNTLFYSIYGGKVKMQGDEKNSWTEAFAANYVQLCGTLAGFCGGFIIFLLSPGLFPQRNSELSVIILLFAAFGYTYAAAVSAYSVRESPARRAENLRQVDFIFVLSNLLLWIAFLIILYMAGYIWASITAFILLIASVWVTRLIPNILYWLHPRR